MKHKLRPYQVDALQFAADHNYCMLDVGMGGGKTMMAVRLAQIHNERRVLVICPRSAFDVWPAEIAKHWNTAAVPRVEVLDGSVAERTSTAREALRHNGTVFLIINFEAFWREPFYEWARNVRWDRIIVDESHHIKAAGGRASNRVHKLGKSARKRLALSGTVMGDSPLDVYGQYRFLDDTIFGTNHQRFLDRYAIMGGFHGYQIMGVKNESELNKKYRQIAHIVPQEALDRDLPPMTELVYYTDLEPSAMKIYRELEKEFVVEMKHGTITADNALVKMLRLHQLENGWFVPDHEEGEEPKTECISTAKIDLFGETLSSLQRQPVVVFCQFTDDLAAVRKRAKELGWKSAELSGKTNQLKRWKDGDADLLVVQIQAGSEAEDFTRARYVIYYSTGLSRTKYLQSLKRIHRPGQNHPTVAIHLRVHNAIGVRIAQGLRKKGNVIKTVLNSYEE